MKNKGKISFGKKDLLPSKIDPKNEKVRISIIMEGDLLDALKLKASTLNVPYQTFMKDLLRDVLFGSTSNKLKVISEDRVREIFREEFKKAV